MSKSIKIILAVFLSSLMFSFFSCDDPDDDETPYWGLAFLTDPDSEADVNECRSIGDSGESCYYRVFQNAAACSSFNPCDTLIVYWVDEKLECASGDLDAEMTNLADEDYLVVCAQAYTSSTGMQSEPFHAALDRMNLVHSIVRRDKDVEDYWSGKNFIVMGKGQGATMALSSAVNGGFQDSNWNGSSRTGMILLEPITNGVEHLADLQDGNCTKAGENLLKRYGEEEFSETGSYAADWQKDRLENILAGGPEFDHTADEFTSTNGSANTYYRIVSCGEFKPALCFGDETSGVKAEQSAALQQLLFVDFNFSKVDYTENNSCSYENCASCTRQDTVSVLSRWGF